MTAALRSAIAVAAALAAALPAQSVFHGNGFPSAYVENTPGRLGQSLTVRFGSPTTPGGIAAVCVAGGLGPTNVPLQSVGIAQVGLDLLDPAFQILLFGLDGNGGGAATVQLPPGLLQPTSPPLFANAVTFEGPLWSVSKTVRIDWANADGWEQAGSLGAARQLHTATAIGFGPRDNSTEVLICGGATGSIIVPVPTASAEVYSPLTRTTTAVASMALPRCGHRTVLTNFGLLLVTGGVTTGGVVTATCEFFEPVTGTFIPAPSMNAPRAGHALTVLDDGRILATGGFADWQNAATSFIGVLNTAQDTAEIFDVATFSWTLLPPMAARRAGHGQTKLPDGRVLVTSGITGGSPALTLGPNNGQIPRYTLTCEIFDPFASSTNAWSAAAPVIVARGYHGQSLLPNGHVLISGGFVEGPSYGAAVADAQCAEWDGVSWHHAGLLPFTAAMHTQVPCGTGALIVGGFTGDLTLLQTVPQVVRHDGLPSLTPVTLAPLGTDHGVGTPQPRGGHTCTPLHDGTFLVYGGGLWPATLANGWIYTPN